MSSCNHSIFKLILAILVIFIAISKTISSKDISTLVHDECGLNPREKLKVVATSLGKYFKIKMNKFENMNNQNCFISLGTSEYTLIQIMKKKHPREYSRLLKEIHEFMQCIQLSDLSKLPIK